jgi:hypothetical protein
MSSQTDARSYARRRSSSACTTVRVVREMHYGPNETPEKRCEHATYGACRNGQMREIVTNVLFRLMAAVGKLVTAGEATRLSLKTDTARNKL